MTRAGHHIDGLLLVIISLMMGGLFSVTLLGIAREEGWLRHGKRSQKPLRPRLLQQRPPNPIPQNRGKGSRRPPASPDLIFSPTLNAILNASSAVFLRAATS